MDAGSARIWPAPHLKTVCCGVIPRMGPPTWEWGGPDARLRFYIVPIIGSGWLFAPTRTTVRAPSEQPHNSKPCLIRDWEFTDVGNYTCANTAQRRYYSANARFSPKR